MRKRSWSIGSMAECQDCGWKLDSRNAQGVGAKHAKHHNHFVRVETTIVSYYNYPDSVFKKNHGSEGKMEAEE